MDRGDPGLLLSSFWFDTAGGREKQKKSDMERVEATGPSDPKIKPNHKTTTRSDRLNCSSLLCSTLSTGRRLILFTLYFTYDCHDICCYLVLAKYIRMLSCKLAASLLRPLCLSTVLGWFGSSVDATLHPYRYSACLLPYTALERNPT